MENYKISIIIPTYNIENYIENCINSIKDQTYKNIEVIIVDDGSIDKTCTIIKNSIEKDDRFILLKKENGGPSSARNMGIDIVSGDYTMFVDGDDYICNTYIEQLVLAVTNNQDLIIGGFEYSFNNGKKNELCLADNFDVDIDCFVEKYFTDYVKRQLVFGPINKLFKTKLIKTIRFDENYKIREDCIFVMNFIKNSSKIVSTRDVHGYYYQQNDFGKSLITKISDNELDANKDFYLSMLEIVKDHNVNTYYISKIYIYTINIYLTKKIKTKKYSCISIICEIRELKKEELYRKTLIDCINNNILDMRYTVPPLLYYLWLKIKTLIEN